MVLCVKANLGLQNLDKMTDATKEEKDFIKGQLLFLRAWWHHQQMEWWGGIPYIDRMLAADEEFNLPRLSFLRVCREMRRGLSCCCRLAARQLGQLNHR